MAILYNNEYYKIINADNDYVNNKTSVTLHKYAFPEDRLFEKENWITVDIVKGNILNYIDNTQEELAQKAYAICDEEGLDKTMDFIDFLNIHPEFTEEFETLSEIRIEGKYIVKNLLSKTGVDYHTLKYSAIWNELGLTEHLCAPVDVDTIFRLLLSSFLENLSLSNLYTTIKEDFYVGAEDV